MRIRLATLSLFVVLPMMNVLAAPAPDPYAILDIGPPPKGETAEEHRKHAIESLTWPHVMLAMAWHDLEVRKLPSIASLKDARPWLAKNIRVKEEDGGRRLCLSFRAGNRTEQVVILNALLRVYVRETKRRQQFYEDILRRDEACILELEQRIESGQHPKMVESYRKGINDLRSIQIPDGRSKIARIKEFAVIKWAK